VARFEARNSPEVGVNDRVALVTAGIIRNKDKLLICQRKAGSRFGLKWEFPGGKLEQGESPEGCLRRELVEELAIDAVIGPEIHRAEFQYPEGFHVRLLFFRVEEYQGAPENLAFERIAWITPADLLAYDFLEADLDLIHRVARGEVRL
jgi:8-oxo-dGTP diphosphatase